MEKDVKAGLVCLVVTLFTIFCIIILANVSSSDNKDSKTTKVSFITKNSPSSSPTPTNKINKYMNEEFYEQNKRLEKCLNELSNTTRCDTTTTKEPIENNEIAVYRCQSNMDCVGHEGYTECLNGYCSCKEKKLHPDQNWKYLKFHKECVLCPDGWDTDGFRYSEFCYKYFHEEKTFDEALNTCKSFGAELMTVDVVYDWHSYQMYLDLHRLPNENIWLGYRSTTFPDEQILFLNVHTNEQLGNRDHKWCYEGAYMNLPPKTNISCTVSGVKECSRFIVASNCQKTNSFICLKRFSKKCEPFKSWILNGCYDAETTEGTGCAFNSECSPEIGLVCNNRICKCKRGTKFQNGKCSA